MSNATPQIEDGYTRIANGIIESLAKSSALSYESRMLLCVFRKTYGYKQTEARITYKQFSEFTGIDRRKVPAILNKLIARNMVTRRKESKEIVYYSFQKDSSKWKEIDTRTGGSLIKEIEEKLPPTEVSVKVDNPEQRNRISKPRGDSLQGVTVTPYRGSIQHPPLTTPPFKETLKERECLELTPYRGARSTKKMKDEIAIKEFKDWWNANIKSFPQISKIAGDLKKSRRTLFLDRLKRFGIGKIKKACLIADEYKGANPEHFKWLDRGIDWVLDYSKYAYNIDKLLERRYDCYLPPKKSEPKEPKRPVPHPVVKTPEEIKQDRLMEKFRVAWHDMGGKEQRELQARAAVNCTLKPGQLGYKGELGICCQDLWIKENE